MTKKREYGGRKPKEENDKKSEVLKIRLTKDEASHLKEFHDKSYFKNFSTLVRRLIFEKPIDVVVTNIELYELTKKLETIENTCESIFRSKKEHLQDCKTQTEEVRKDVKEIKEQINSYRKAELFLVDLRQIPDTQKRGKWYFRLSGD